MSLTLAIEIKDSPGLAQFFAKINPLDEHNLLLALARLIRAQTIDRIRDEKSGPDGTPWLKNRAGTSILYRSSELARSIGYRVRGAQAIVGSGLKYARIHQEGGVIVPKDKKALRFVVAGNPIFAQRVTIPARPFIGLSAENRAELLLTTVLRLREMLQ
jgi:phage gpG-like protein